MQWRDCKKKKDDFLHSFIFSEKMVGEAVKHSVYEFLKQDTIPLYSDAEE